MIIEDKNKIKILVIGGGVSGLTTALELLEKNYEVTIIAEQYAPAIPEIVSQVAGALWEFPPAVCGSHGNDTEENLNMLKKWSIISHKKFDKFKDNSEYKSTGIRERYAYFFFKYNIHERIFNENYYENKDHQKMIEVKKFIGDGFNDKKDEIIRDLEKNGVKLELFKNGIKDAYRYKSFVIDTNQYLKWLKGSIKKLDGKILNGKIESLSNENITKLKKEYNINIIINCTGYASKNIIKDDELKPLRGFLIHVKNNGKLFPILKDCISISKPNDIENGNKYHDFGFTFIVPKNDETVILGGYAEINETNIDRESKQNNEIFEEMKKNCISLYPNLEKVEEISRHSGIRPFRITPRVEKDNNIEDLIHNYGHGGSGYTLSWGCAEKVRSIIDKINK